MKVKWDYTELAASYVNRPAYSEKGLDDALKIAGLKGPARVCDVGAGVAHLSIPLLERGFHVDAVEPNDAMRALGIERTRQYPLVSWYEGTGEETGRSANSYDLVTFGSSFNVVDQEKAMREIVRIAKPKGWFMCLWNHRDLDEPLQREVESAIKSFIADYDYGARRADQTEVIQNSGLFENLETISAPVEHRISADEWLNAWRSHATLQRQAGSRENFEAIVAEIDKIVRGRKLEQLVIPYVTRIWICRVR